MTKKSFGALPMLTGSHPLLSTDKEMNSRLFAGSPTTGDSWGFDELVDQIEAWWNRMDRGLRKAMNNRKEKISCDACPHEDPGCCHQKVIVTIFEILPLLRWIARHGLDSPEFRARLKSAGEIMEGTDRERYFHDQHRCVFMEKGRCSIYAVRPQGCRSYFVISDPKHCQPGDHEGIFKINDEAYVNEHLKLAHEAHGKLGLKENEMRILMGALPRMVALGLEMMESDDFQGFIRSQKWPTADNLEEWIGDGKNPFSEQLYQISKRPAP